MKLRTRRRRRWGCVVVATCAVHLVFLLPRERASAADHENMPCCCCGMGSQTKKTYQCESDTAHVECRAIERRCRASTAPSINTLYVRSTRIVHTFTLTYSHTHKHTRTIAYSSHISLAGHVSLGKGIRVNIGRQLGSALQVFTLLLARARSVPTRAHVCR